ncbi:MAG: M12 family metallopeptidase, partial [Phycisphaerae bacterium]
CGVRFNPRTNQANYIKLTDSSGNSSFVGQIGGVQNVNLFNWSFRYIVIHELMHALGVHHEQQRSDRDPFVVINQSNIQSAYFNANFPKNGATPVGAYDFESIMHYDACTFSTCCPVASSCACPSNCRSISAQPAYAAFQNLMGNR